MAILWLFDTCGLIIGPLMWLAGLVAIILCIRASRQTENLQRQRLAMWFSFLPFAVGIVGVIFGLVVLQTTEKPVPANEAAYALGKVCLAGFVVTAIPLAWALYLGRSRPQMA